MKCHGDIDCAIEIMKEVAQWCEDTGKNMWKVKDLSKEIFAKGLNAENFYVGKVNNENAAVLKEAMAIPYDDPNDTFFVRSQSVSIPEFLMYPEIAHA